MLKTFAAGAVMAAILSAAPAFAFQPGHGKGYYSDHTFGTRNFGAYPFRGYRDGVVANGRYQRDERPAEPGMPF